MRYRRYRHGNRPDMTIGCNDKFDAEFLWWLLCRGRSRKRARFYAHIAATYPERCIVVNTREQSSFRLPQGQDAGSSDDPKESARSSGR